MDIMYTINKSYIDVMLASINSLVIKGRLDSVDFHIVHSDLDEEDIKRIKDLLSKYTNVSLKFYKFDLESIKEYNLPNWRGSQIANVRLFALRRIKEENKGIKHLLYLDSDTIVKGPLDGLKAYDEDLKAEDKAPIAAVKEDGSPIGHYNKVLGLKEYYNTGALYIDLERWDCDKFEESAREFIKTNKKPLIYPDQDFFNLLFKGKIVTLPNKYNLSLYPYILNSLEAKLFYKNRQGSLHAIFQAAKDPYIKHSIGLLGIKHFFKNKLNPLTKEFLYYIRDLIPDYELKELPNKIKNFFGNHQRIFKTCFILKESAPPCVIKKINSLTLKLQKATTIKEK